MHYNTTREQPGVRLPLVRPRQRPSTGIVCTHDDELQRRHPLLQRRLPELPGRLAELTLSKAIWKTAPSDRGRFFWFSPGCHPRRSEDHWWLDPDSSPVSDVDQLPDLDRRADVRRLPFDPDAAETAKGGVSRPGPGTRSSPLEVRSPPESRPHQRRCRSGRARACSPASRRRSEATRSTRRGCRSTEAGPAEPRSGRRGRRSSRPPSFPASRGWPPTRSRSESGRPSCRSCRRARPFRRRR